PFDPMQLGRQVLDLWEAIAGEARTHE
ncbi:MAG: hypothetical protein QOF32_1461, partial [Gammaproteobacteria bacterium]|nr:hypothetical protein [Gammaproteobacteria bacterium]